MKLAESIAKAEASLAGAGISTARLDTIILFEAVTGRERSYLYAHGESELTPAQQSKLEVMIGRRLKREPIAYIIGRKEFFGLEFEVNEHVLIPRAETEVLVEYIINSAPESASLLDVGTGSGAIAISVKHFRPDISVTASDISPEAISMAKRNAEAHAPGIEFVESDLFDSLSSCYDIIAANLPYVAPDKQLEPELNHEPKVALFSGEQGLSHYRRFFYQAPRFLADSGYAIVETEPGQLSGMNLPKTTSIESISDFISVIRGLRDD